MDKKTRTLSVKVGQDMANKAQAALQNTSTETISRFFRGCLEDLIRAHQAGEQIQEPIQLLRRPRRRTARSSGD